MSVIGECQPVARVPHRCDACNGPIAAGQKHDRWGCVDGGTVTTCRAHSTCLAIVQAERRLSPRFNDEFDHPDDFRSEVLAPLIDTMGGLLIGRSDTP